MVMEQLESYDTSPKPLRSHSIDGASDGVIQPGNPLYVYVWWFGTCFISHILGM